MQPATISSTLVDSYLDLLKKSLTRTISSETYSAAEPFFGLVRWWFLPLQGFLRARGWTVVKFQRGDASARAEGRDWPADAETMIGLKRLDNIQQCIERIRRHTALGCTMFIVELTV
jgi:O-methyltransferase